MKDGVKVDLEALTTFSDELGALADSHYVNDMLGAGYFHALSGTMSAESGYVPLSEQCLPPSGFLEAQAFAHRHDIVVTSAQQFMTDSLNGVVCLGSGAETIALNYAATDGSNAQSLQRITAEMNQVRANAAGKSPFPVMGVTVTGTGQVRSGDVTGVFNPTPGAAQPLLTTGSATAEPQSSTTTQRPPQGKLADPKQVDQNFQKQKDAFINQLKSGQDTTPKGDPSKGTVIGSGPGAIVVPADGTNLTMRKKPSSGSPTPSSSGSPTPSTTTPSQPTRAQ